VKVLLAALAISWALGAQQVKTNPKDGLAYVWIPPGSFRMGCSPGDTECRADESPATEIAIPKGFWLGQTPVTQKAYRRVTGSNPSNFRGDNRPVEQVSWEQARSYCQAIGGRLPTEAEWEYAARAGVAAPRYGKLDDIAWYVKNSGGRTHDAGQKKPNAFGLFDMLGNVWEWTGDKAQTLRGGSWNSYPMVVRASSRYWPEGRMRYWDFGLRCVAE
jgi:formylglycine-generating enzyme required for sulfatase activity